jgi:hypothetical protein
MVVHDDILRAPVSVHNNIDINVAAMPRRIPPALR